MEINILCICTCNGLQTLHILSFISTWSIVFWYKKINTVYLVNHMYQVNVNIRFIFCGLRKGLIRPCFGFIMYKELCIKYCLVCFMFVTSVAVSAVYIHYFNCYVQVRFLFWWRLSKSALTKFLKVTWLFCTQSCISFVWCRVILHRHVTSLFALEFICEE